MRKEKTRNAEIRKLLGLKSSHVDLHLYKVHVLVLIVLLLIIGS